MVDVYVVYVVMFVEVGVFGGQEGLFQLFGYVFYGDWGVLGFVEYCYQFVIGSVDVYWFLYFYVVQGLYVGKFGGNGIVQIVYGGCVDQCQDQDNQEDLVQLVVELSYWVQILIVNFVVVEYRLCKVVVGVGIGECKGNSQGLCGEFVRDFIVGLLLFVKNMLLMFGCRFCV